MKLLGFMSKAIKLLSTEMVGQCRNILQQYIGLLGFTSKAIKLLSAEMVGQCRNILQQYIGLFHIDLQSMGQHLVKQPEKNTKVLPTKQYFISKTGQVNENKNVTKYDYKPETCCRRSPTIESRL